MSQPRARAGLLLLLGAAPAAIGCGGNVIDQHKAESAIGANVRRQAPKGVEVASVHCPSGIPVDRGRTFRCTVRLGDGTRRGVTLRILNGDADVSFVRQNVQPRG